MTQSDELVARLRDPYARSAWANGDFYDDCATALEAQAARVKRLEAELDIANKQIAETGRAWTADREQLEAQIEAFRMAAEEAKHCIKVHCPGGIPTPLAASTIALVDNALMAALRNTEMNDG